MHTRSLAAKGMLAPRRPHASQASHGSRLQPTASKAGDKEDTGISVSFPQVKHALMYCHQ